MADDEKLIKLIRSTFDIYGLIINRKLCVTVANYLKKNPHEDPDKWLAQTIEHLLTQNLPTPHVTLDNLKIALTESVKPESTLKQTETVFNVIDAFTVPKIVYDLNKKKYVVKTMDSDLFPDAKYKSLVFKERLDLMWHRTLKHAHFASSKFGKIGESKEQLVPIEYLLSESKTKDVYVMGVLAQLTEGQYYLEDYDALVKISLKDTCFNSSLIVEGSIVLAKGKYSDGIFYVEAIDFPPAELSERSRTDFGPVNTFGGEHPTLLKFSEKLKAHEDANQDDILIFISDFWVDNENVLKRFRILLSGYSDFPPVAIVLCGHFLSSSSNVSNVKILKESFKRLARIIAEFPLIQQNTKFVFVPGPFDFCAPKILPRPPLPNSIMEDFIKVIPGTYLATNPCRIQYCTKEIVVLRENMLSKLCRNTLHYPKSENDDRNNKAKEIFKAFTKSIIRQSHLTPLLFSMIPVYWKHDQAMQLHPLPDVVVIADEFQPCEETYFDCTVVSPGPFVKSNFSFTTYNPYENKTEDCDIPEEES